MTCNCYSDCEFVGHKFAEREKYDLPEGVEIPPHFGEMTYPGGQPKTHVAVDKCIAHVVRHLWGRGVWTESSCCGHNKQAPTLVFYDRLNMESVQGIWDIIGEVDDRKFELLSWHLCEVTPEGVRPYRAEGKR